MRLFLNQIVGFRGLCQDKSKDFFAVAKAHRHFILRLRYWYKKRSKTNVNVYESDLVLKESIALAHYVKKRQFFSEVAP